MLSLPPSLHSTAVSPSQPVRGQHRLTKQTNKQTNKLLKRIHNLLRNPSSLPLHKKIHVFPNIVRPLRVVLSLIEYITAILNKVGGDSDGDGDRKEVDTWNSLSCQCLAPSLAEPKAQCLRTLPHNSSFNSFNLNNATSRTATATATAISRDWTDRTPRRIRLFFLASWLALEICFSCSSNRTMSSGPQMPGALKKALGVGVRVECWLMQQ